MSFLKDKTKLTRNGKTLLILNFVFLFSSLISLFADFIQTAIILGTATIATSVMLFIASERPIGTLSVKKEST